ncbi:hypothetical protein [Bacillus cereus]|uniref:hypothetical protein n=1 Tax=Bacillus cereus TaxID=1396 RepID=UPI00077AD414|nr:hypothetical protein [Bacillus cereus]KXY21232.1 hypothetical protein AT273_21350 [Bacillus cereus]MBW3216466.1 hypothetical protein [Salmonella enterica subsp. enterica serovar Javiana]
MKLSKQELAAVMTHCISTLGEKMVNEHMDSQKLAQASTIHNNLFDNTTPKERREATISLLGKAIDEFLESKE